MKILITNDDGYKAKGLGILATMMQDMGEVSVLAPKFHQSGMGIAVEFGQKPLAYKKLESVTGTSWAYLDSTPAACVKLAIHLMDPLPEIVLSGINHGCNTSTGSCYSGTLGACEEAAINGIPAIGVSLDNMEPDADFSAVRKFFPEIFRKLLAYTSGKYGLYYNVNFPKLPATEIKGIRVTRMGMGKWIKEFTDWDPKLYGTQQTDPSMEEKSSDISAEDGEHLYKMVGEYVDSPDNSADADNGMMNEGYITITAHNIISTDLEELSRLRKSGMDQNFKPETR